MPLPLWHVKWVGLLWLWANVHSRDHLGGLCNFALLRTQKSTFPPLPAGEALGADLCPLGQSTAFA